ncbi:hypothetical protein [Pedobacter cryoconitis]|uniref:Uncharacterized protein n=1 Tax=Pedobacter cryoconitis TaxID=188932 RepID=A0A7X0J139_9SPHI|nr:hypothetical protein [Pedobacter cryoconitis]MBB6499146.1 hypothetical protein [Pedobacter cryoconitis]
MNKFLKNVKVLSFIAVLLLMSGLIFTQSAFKNHKSDVVTYYFNGNSTSEMKEAAAWGPNQNPEYACTNKLTTLPCHIEVPADQTLDDYLISHSNAQILAEAGSRITVVP